MGAVLVFVVAAAPVLAQPAAPPAVTTGWRDGFIVQNEGGEYRLQIGLLAQADARFAVQDSADALTSTFAIRRLRPYLRGRLANRFEFYLNPDFANGTLVVQDAYVDTHFSTAFRVRVGKGKAPYGHERLHSASSLLFYERGTPTAIAPNRDIGIQVLGDISDGILSYSAGVMNGVPDGLSADQDTNDSKDLLGRVVVRPFNKAPETPLGGLGFALSGSTGDQRGAVALPAYRTSTIGQTFFSYTGASAEGTRKRYSPFVFYYYKAFGGFAELGHSSVPVAKGQVRGRISHDAWQATGSYVLTGEKATDAGVRPRANFDFGNGNWGAFQVAARYHTLTVDREAIDLGLASEGSSREVDAWTVNVNWYLTPFFKYVLQLERFTFDGSAAGAREAETVLAFRTQLNF